MSFIFVLILLPTATGVLILRPEILFVAEGESRAELFTEGQVTVKIGTGIKGKKFGCPCRDVRLSGFKQGNIDIKKLAKRIAQIEEIKNGEIELLEAVFTIREAK